MFKNNNIQSIYFYYLTLSIFSLVGIYARFSGISIWPLADDEYHTVESVRNILKHGFPLFDCGGIYSRGILYQYFLAALNMVFGGNEALIYRSANSIISLFAIPAIYKIARKVISKEGALICLMIYMSSVWLVEYARYIRMYMPFLVIFIWYIYFLFEVTTNSNLNKLKYLLGLSALSILVYEEGIFLTILNFLVIIFLYRTNYKNMKLWLFTTIAVVIFLISFLYLIIDFRHWGVNNFLPPEISGLSPGSKTLKNGPLQIPSVLVSYIFDYYYWAIAGIMLLSSSVAAFLWINIRYRSHLLLLLSFLILIFAVSNIFTLVIFTITIFYFLGWLKFDESARPVTVYIIYVVSTFFIFWLLFVLSTDVLLSMHGDGAVINFKKALVTLLKYPNYYDQVIYPWVIGQPIITVIIGGIISAGIIIDYLLKRKNSPIINQSVIIILLVCTLVAVTRQPYHDTRYTLLLYPLLIIVSVYYLASIISIINIKNFNSIALLTASLAFILISDDHDFNHLLKIDTQIVNYRIDYTPGRRFHLRNRMDFESPSRYINSQLQKNDYVITSVRPVHHYLDRLDYYYITPEDSQFWGVSACDGKKELWTNAKLLYTNDMLNRLINNGERRIWLIMKSGLFPYPNSLESTFYTKHKNNISYLSVDKNIVVYRFNDRIDLSSLNL